MWGDSEFFFLGGGDIDQCIGEGYVRGDRDSDGGYVREGEMRRMGSMSQAVADETSIGNITIWPFHLHPTSQLTPTLTNKQPFSSKQPFIP